MACQIITIDGPAGAGKTTVSKGLAKKLGCVYVDTGALYRGVAYEILNRSIDWKNEKSLERFLDTLDLNFTFQDNMMILTSFGTDISGFIRTEEISMMASAVSAIFCVRKALLDIQRHIGQTQDAVFEGRDMGTVVFPNADYKFYLFADLNIRSLRRFKELDPENTNLKTIETQMVQRDKNDSTRKEAPLKPAIDAILIDSTHMTIDEVIRKMIFVIRK